MTANKKNPTLIQVTSRGQVTGHMTCKEFRDFMGSNDFIGNLVERFNEWKQSIGEPERVTQVLNCK
jgi:hypothetical protein